jgi:hypothetical protein
MWVELNKEIFNDYGQINELRKLIQDLCYKRRYDIYLDLPNVKALPLFDTIYDENKEFIEQYYNRFIQGDNSIDYNVSNDVQDQINVFSISEAITFFNLPLIIILENSDNDGYFVDALIREFKKASRKIQRFKDNYWIRYEMSGGSGNFIHFIEREKKNFNGNSKFLRCFVLVDSDLEYPQSTNAKRQPLINYLEQNNILYHILEKREIENYLPDANMENIDNTHDFIKMYLDAKKLSPIQKDFIDIEKGFQKNKRALEKDKPQVHAFYAHLSEKDFDKLRYGLGSTFEDFKNNFPKLFENATQEGLMERCQYQANPDELKEILNKINQLL